MLYPIELWGLGMLTLCTDPNTVLERRIINHPGSIAKGFDSAGLL